MNGQVEIIKVMGLISWWITTIKVNNAVGFVDINKVAEGVALKLLNEIYNYRLENLNYPKDNYPGIDLGDKTDKIGFQISSRTDTKKIKESLEKFVKGPKDTYTNGIRFLILSLDKKPRLSEKKYKKIYPDFDPEQHILTATDLIREIRRIYDTDMERFFRIKEIVEKELGVRAEGKDPKALLGRMYEGSKRYYGSLTGENGRFRHLKISDIILPRPAAEMEWIDTMATVKEEQETEESGSDDKSMDVLVNVLKALPVLWQKGRKHAVIVGEGGMGKTVSLVRLWEEYTESEAFDGEKPVPVFIQLNEFNELLDDSDRKGFIGRMIGRHYLEGDAAEEEIRRSLQKQLKEKNYFPSVILLLDGFNEITADKRLLLIELKDIIEHWHGVQVVISSRYDMRNNFNWSGFQLMKLLELVDNQVDAYLQEYGLSLPDYKMVGDGQRFSHLLKNPMMLTIYASTCEVEKVHGRNKLFSFKERVESPGELLWNFMEAQVARVFERLAADERKKWYYKFLFKFMLPAIGYEMEKEGRFELARDRHSSSVESAVYIVFFETALEKETAFGGNIE